MLCGYTHLEPGHPPIAGRMKTGRGAMSCLMIFKQFFHAAAGCSCYTSWLRNLLRSLLPHSLNPIVDLKFISRVVRRACLPINLLPPEVWHGEIRRSSFPGKIFNYLKLFCSSRWSRALEHDRSVIFHRNLNILPIKTPPRRLIYVRFYRPFEWFSWSVIKKAPSLIINSYSLREIVIKVVSICVGGRGLKR